MRSLTVLLCAEHAENPLHGFAKGKVAELRCEPLNPAALVVNDVRSPRRKRHLSSVRHVTLSGTPDTSDRHNSHALAYVRLCLIVPVGVRSTGE